MRLLCFQAKRFWWRAFEQTLADAPAPAGETEVTDAVVAFVHVEAADSMPEREASVFRQALKHLKWLANKRGLRVIVLHSFTHLGADSGEPEAARALLARLADRLTANGYTTHVTPFGYFNEWDLSVYGESLAKVWKQI
ncbi:MAG: threonyl-tRNA synthetase editing domain-containing protein [Candidatus Binatia bacterium]